MGRLFTKHPKTEAELQSHLDALTGMTKGEQPKLFEHLYSCLSILDTKSSSLLASNAIISAVFAIFMSADLSPFQWIIIHVGMALILASSLLLLLVVWIHWSPTEDLNDLAKYKIDLLRRRDSRTKRYEKAWILSFLAIVALCFFLAIRFVLKFPGCVC